ncbi:MAG TPA: G5 domain-containing protein [Candidatus Saccharimonadales bacterium]|nr:G5 domain-containing protein [Candidatus Saccharimonadales bacterium]HSX46744.1 G5 domain-containing protein [Patescibacteria group bacterium]
MKNLFNLKRAAYLLVAISLASTLVLGFTAPNTASASDKTANSSQAKKKPAKKAKVTTKTVTQIKSLAFTTINQNDPNLPEGQTKVVQVGKKGTEKQTYKVTYKNGKQTKKSLVSRKVILAATPQIVAIGTYKAPPPPPPSPCDPNYSGACVPIASDVDCAGGSGNGPAYVRGPVRVIGSDIYGLDRDGDGVGCE